MMFKIPGDVNPRVYILWLLRSGRVNDWESLAREFGVGSRFAGTAELIILDYLRSLQSAGLIVMEARPDDRSYKIPTGYIKLSEKWSKIQTALDLSLTELTKMSASAIIATPYFGKPERAAEATDLFVLMPFDPELRPIYEDHITQCARDLSLSIARGDDSFTARAVMDDIWNAISGARAIIADCTGRNPNVFYEIGIAHTIGKPVILITQATDDVPFDIRHLRYIQYDYTPRGMRIFEKRLTDTLQSELGLERPGEKIRFPVLFIVGDESDSSLRRLHQEFDAVEAALGDAKMISQFPWSQHYIPDLGAALINKDFEPRIVHIIGRSNGHDSLMEGRAAEAHRYDASTLRNIFQPAANSVECVILSACFSAEQAEAIASEIRYVIGIHSHIGGAATSFAIDFYQSLSAGRSVVEAHEIASNRVRLEGLPEESLPKLVERN